ncbi:MAG TPA: ABC transporter permease [Anaerolineae bacterium]|nr:ABC transporter permease [Anaerolineae bacterium]
MKLQVSLNPVLVKELRGRMRGPRAYLFLAAILSLLAVLSYGLYRLAILSVQSFGGGPAGATIGQSVFIGLVFLALIVICAVAPSLTASAISGEYERKTFDLLAATPLRPASLLFGKLAVSLSYVALILLAAVPLVSLSYVFGGVATIDMLQVLLLLLGFALTFSAIGLFFSALFRRTTPAVLASYIVLALFVIGGLFVYPLIGAIRQNQQPPPTWLLALNPFSALASALVNPAVSGGLGVGVAPMFSGPLYGLLWFFSGFSFDPSTMNLSRPLWHYTVGLYAWLTIALYLAGTQLVKPVRRFRLSRRGWLGAALFLVASIGAALMIYGPLTPDRILAWLRWSISPSRDLIVNGKFDAPLEQTWQVSTEVEHPEESAGEVAPVADAGRTILRFSRTGEGHAETRITQALDQTAPSDGWLQVRVTLRVQRDELYLCGIMGSECPLMIKLNYEDAAGRPHEWMQGLNTETIPTGWMAFPEACTTCEMPQPFAPVPPKEWYTYESPNILERIRPDALPQRIKMITLAAAGHTYEVEVAEVALLMREGRPPDWGSGPGGFATPTPVPPFGPVMIEKAIQIAPPLPAPTLAPPPTLAPTATPIEE